ncbi:MAG: SLC13 family permease [Candidatus Borkfalkiaceae bacterium]|nr:SLC13 family permease [Christensenellaceae bacterium]
MGKVTGFIKSRIMVIIAWTLAIISMFFVPIDKEYLGYFDLSTLACLFLTLLVVGAFSNIHTFEIVSRKIVSLLKNTRRMILSVVFITYVGSMILANDMALLTFLPLGWMSLKKSGQQKYTAFTFIMQNIAANLGGMLTPFGNPQNLYLYSYYNISNSEFFGVMFPPFAISLVIIFACCMFVRPEPLELRDTEEYSFNLKRTIIYSVLFVISVLAVFRVFPWYYPLALVSVAMLFLDVKAYLKVSYSLLLTFCAFFVFSGNVSRIDFIRDFLCSLTEKNTLLTGVVACQCISNVPTAVLLSRFATDYRALLVAVNIGGVGTLISSLASLITFSKYREVQKGKTLSYIGLFSAFNFSFLLILTAAEYLFIYVL